MSSAPPRGQKFDAFARSYVDLHRKSIEASGEDPAYFHQYKRRCIERLVGPDFREPILDYGCGVGTLTEQLLASFPLVHGFDPSTESVAMARERAPRATFHPDVAEIPDGHFGLLVMRRDGCSSAADTARCGVTSSCSCPER